MLNYYRSCLRLFSNTQMYRWYMQQLRYILPVRSFVIYVPVMTTLCTSISTDARINHFLTEYTHNSMRMHARSTPRLSKSYTAAGKDPAGVGPPPRYVSEPMLYCEFGVYVPNPPLPPPGSWGAWWSGGLKSNPDDDILPPWIWPPTLFGIPPSFLNLV